MSSAEDEVLETAAALVSAFGGGEVDSYFDFFAANATFVFHSTPGLLDSRDAYHRLWTTWERDDGFRVLSCDSSEQHVQHLGEVAVFTHRVRTRVSTNAGEETLAERETIVFRRIRSGQWVAVHEHLSPDPGTD